MLPRALAELLQAQVAVLDVPAHAEVRAVDLQHDAGLGHGLVFMAHGLGNRIEVGLVVLVVVVAEEQRHHAGRGRAHEGLGRFRAGDGRFQVVRVGSCGLRVAHADRPVTGRRLAARAAGIAEHALLQARELGEVLVDEGIAGAAEAGQPILDVGGIAGLGHLAVVDEIDAGFELFLHHLGHGPTHALGQSRRIDRHALLLGIHHADQIVRSRQAARMGGEKALRAAFHRAPRVEASSARRPAVAAGWPCLARRAWPRPS